MCDSENGFTFRMSDEEKTLCDTFKTLLNGTELTDCVLVCKQTNQCDSSSSNSTTNTTNNANSTDTVANNADNNWSGNASSQQQQPLTNEWSILRHIKSHRAILSACSDYFSAIFASIQPLILNSGSGVPVVVITDVDFDDLDAIVEFIYKGMVCVKQSRLKTFIASAHKLSVTSLVDIALRNSLIEQTDAREIEISRLKQEKSSLENELKMMRDTEKQRMDRYKIEYESEQRVASRERPTTSAPSHTTLVTVDSVVPHKKSVTFKSPKPLPLESPSQHDSKVLQKIVSSVDLSREANSIDWRQRSALKQSYTADSNYTLSAYYQCPLCHEVFTYGDSFDSHIQSVHLNHK